MKTSSMKFYFTFGQVENDDHQETIIVSKEDAEIILEELISAESMEHNQGLEDLTTLIDKILGDSGARKSGTP